MVVWPQPQPFPMHDLCVSWMQHEKKGGVDEWIDTLIKWEANTA